MFSKLVLRSGPLLRSQLQQRAILAVAARPSSSVATQGEKSAEVRDVTKDIKVWDEANKVYYGPDRDMANFPTEVRAEFHPPVRLGFIPDAWFKMFYEKTGVTGPYLFGGGLLTFLLSKEILVYEHGLTEAISFWLAVIFVLKKFGPQISAMLDKETETYEEKRWAEPLKLSKSTAEQFLVDSKKEMWQLDGMNHLFEAKKENVDIQLEAIYRERLSAVHKAVKQRLDYQMELESTKRNFEQEHMVNWIVDSVVKSITPQQEKQSISKCLTDLKALQAAV